MNPAKPARLVLKVGDRWMEGLPHAGETKSACESER